MYWLDEYVNRLFDSDELPDDAAFAAEFGIDEEQLAKVDSAQLFEAVMRKFRRDATRVVPKVTAALLEKSMRGDVPAIRLLLTFLKPETQRGKLDDPMETFREL